MRGGDNSAAAQAFGALVDRYPGSDLVGEAVFLRGEALFRAGDHAGAVLSFQRLLRDFAEHESSVKALYRLGVSLCQLDRWQPAEAALG